MRIVRRTLSPEEAAAKIWPQPDAACISALRVLITESPYCADVILKVYPNFESKPGETIKIRDFAEQCGLSPGLCFKFFRDIGKVGAGALFNRRPQADDRVPYERFTWHVDFDDMISRAVSEDGPALTR